MTLRIGSGAGYAGDRIGPAIEVAEHGDVQSLVFECLAERTIALAQLAKQQDPDAGYGQLLHERMEAVLPYVAGGGMSVVTNLGAANPIAALRETRRTATDLGYAGTTIAAVTGDDVLEQVLASDAVVWETGRPVRELADRLTSANAYLGVEALLPALESGAQIVIGGRIADPSLFLAPIVHHYGWDLDDWHRLGAATVICHLMECSAQVCGGYYADPGFKDVPNLVDIGYPIAEVAADGTAVITKVDGSGGMVTPQTCKEQLLYEVGDPRAYLTPDVTADFSQVTLEQVGHDRVAVASGTGSARPRQLKVTLGVESGFVGEGEISYAGPGAYPRSQLAAEVARERILRHGIPEHDLRVELIGVDATLAGWVARPSVPPSDIRLRIAGRSDDRRVASRIGEEVEALYLTGPAGGAGAVSRVKPVIAACSTLIDRDSVEVRTHVEVAGAEPSGGPASALGQRGVESPGIEVAGAPAQAAEVRR